MAEEIRIQDANLRAAVRGIFAAAGSSEREQHLAANHLVEANLRGHDSHGVGMIPAYIANFAAGEMKLNHAPKVLVDKGTLLLCDGDLGLGQTMAHDSVAMAIERAKQHGSCILSLRASHHIGRIGHWSEQCAAEGLISLHFVNVISDPSVAPFGGRAARVGTNPISIGIPRRGQEPVIVDFATSKLAVGKVRVAYNKGVDVPPGVLLDHTGEPTTSPAALFEEPRGTLLPFGDHKGWGLSLACELLAGALSGGGTQHHPRQRPAIINSMFSVVVSPEAVGTTETFFPQIDAFIEWARTPLPGRDAEVLIAGEPERRTRAARLRDGIPVDVTTWEQINGAADTVGLPRAQLQALAGLA